MEIENAYKLLRQRYPGEISFSSALLRFLESGDFPEEAAPLDLSPEEIIITHSENSMAMASQLLRALSLDKKQ